MNVVFISPHFPLQYFHFVTALRERGINVLGIGDAPYDSLRHELREALGEYFFTPSLHDLGALQRAVGYLTWRHGRIDRIESLNETWLEVEAHLREDFNVPGIRLADIRRMRSKLDLRDLYQQAGIAHPETTAAVDAATVKAFARKVGYPLVLKPVVGVGAANTFKVSRDEDVEAAASHPLKDFIAQSFVQGAIVTFDGLTDREGRIVFKISHEYSNGVMENVLEQGDISFWSHREMTAELDALGTRTVEALGLRERWFHLEFFRPPDGKLVSLEANIRPPGCFITDMMNYTCDIDVYRLWAQLLAGDSLERFKYTPRYHLCHIARRNVRRYRHSYEQVVHHLGPALLFHRFMPIAYREAVGDEMYLTRHDSLEAMREAVRFVQATG